MSGKVRSSIFLKVAAPIYVPLDDMDRLAQVTHFEWEVVKPSIANDEFWKPFLAARDSFDKMAAAISDQHGWPSKHARMMLATAMGMYQLVPSEPEKSIIVINAVKDLRLWRWCTAQLARAALSIQKAFLPNHKSGAEKSIAIAEKYVRTGDPDSLDDVWSEGTPSDVATFIEDVRYVRQEAVENGGFLETDALSPKARGLSIELRELGEDLPGTWMMLGSPATELAYLAWSGALIGQDDDSPDPVGNLTFPYMFWAMRVFAFGHAFEALSKYISRSGNVGEAFTINVLKEELLKGYAAGNDVLKAALLSYPPPPNWTLQAKAQDFEWT